MGLLDGGLASSIYSAFKGRLLKGELRREVVPESGTTDDLGDPIDGAPETWPIEGFFENYDALFAARAGIPRTDLKVCFFAESLPDGFEPLQDDKVMLRNHLGEHWFQIRNAETDPAVALWECQSFKIRAPA